MNKKSSGAEKRERPVSPAIHARVPLSDLPTAKRVSKRVLQVWLVGIFVFGFLPAATYGWFTWLLDAYQWRRVWTLYLLAVPLVGGITLVALPLWWMQPILRSLKKWQSGRNIDRRECAIVYNTALNLPKWVAASAVISTTVSYLLGGTYLYLTMHQPLIEYLKLYPAMVLVGGLSGAYCYFGTTVALYPVLVWCSRILERMRLTSKISLDVKFLSVTYVLVIAVLCMMHPSGFTLGQVLNETHLQERALYRLEVARQRFLLSEWLDASRQVSGQAERLQVLQGAVLGDNGYVFLMDPEGAIQSAHPFGHTHVDQERFVHEGRPFQGLQGVFVSRIRDHRVIAYQHWPELKQTVVSVVYPGDFQTQLEHYLQFSVIPIAVVLLIVLMFGNYYVRGMTVPLADMSRAAHRIAERRDLKEHVPVATDDELGELASSFNWMVRQLRRSQTELEHSNRRLKSSANEMKALNQEMEDLLHAVSHDLRSPLINIQGFSKRLERLMDELQSGMDGIAAKQGDAAKAEAAELRDRVDPKLRESLDYISKGIDRMDTLLNQLLAMSRVGRKADPLQPNDFDAIVSEVVATFNHQLEEADIEVRKLALPKDIPSRRNEISQVFSNLIANAIRYMGDSAERVIEIGGRIVREDGEVECYVQDTGVGIEPINHERIFQTFTRLQTVDVPGEGVGLAYVRKVLRSHKGRIWVESEMGRGSRFCFRIPLHFDERGAEG